VSRKDPDGASSAMPSQGVFSILLSFVNALMLRLGRTYIGIPRLTRPSARVSEQISLALRSGMTDASACFSTTLSVYICF